MAEPDPGTRREAECEECGGTGAQRTRVTFVDRTAAMLPLCPDCVSEFEAGALVDAVVALSDPKAQPDRT